VICGLILDMIYLSLGISATAIVGKASEILPQYISMLAVLLLAILSIVPLLTALKKR